MNSLLLSQVVEQLKNKGVVFEDGLSDEEILYIEQINKFHFPPDLKALLQFAMPLSSKSEFDDYIQIFPDWRREPVTLMMRSRNHKLEGFIWQLEHDAEFWLKRWGVRPPNLSEAIAIVQKDYQSAPILIPVFAHRSIPSLPCIAGNPVFSIAGVDIIHYGSNLLNYLDKEFHLEMSIPRIKSPQYIEFWDDFLSQNR